MARMVLYTVDPAFLYTVQHHDPFFSYLTHKLMTLGQVSSPGRFLDLGCGSGRMVFEAGRLGLESVGVDYETKAIRIAKAQAKRLRIHNASFYLADITKLSPRRFGTFDYICLMEVIEHIKDFQKVIDYAYTSLKRGGTILLTTPNDPNQWTVLDDYARHVRRFTPKEVRRTLGKFHSVRILTVGFPLHRFIVTLYHLMMKRGNRMHEPRLFRRNAIVTWVYSIIGRIVLAFDDLYKTDWGTTIIAVARK